MLSLHEKIPVARLLEPRVFVLALEQRADQPAKVISIGSRDNFSALLSWRSGIFHGKGRKILLHKLKRQPSVAVAHIWVLFRWAIASQ